MGVPGEGCARSPGSQGAELRLASSLPQHSNDLLLLRSRASVASVTSGSPARAMAATTASRPILVPSAPAGDQRRCMGVGVYGCGCMCVGVWVWVGAWVGVGMNVCIYVYAFVCVSVLNGGGPPCAPWLLAQAHLQMHTCTCKQTLLHMFVRTLHMCSAVHHIIHARQRNTQTCVHGRRQPHMRTHLPPALPAPCSSNHSTIAAQSLDQWATGSIALPSSFAFSRSPPAQPVPLHAHHRQQLAQHALSGSPGSLQGLRVGSLPRDADEVVALSYFSRAGACGCRVQG